MEKAADEAGYSKARWKEDGIAAHDRAVRGESPK